MKQWLSTLLKDTNPQGRNAFRMAVIVIAALLPALPILITEGRRTGTWQIYATLAGMFVMGVLMAISAILARRNRVDAAVTLILAGSFLIAPYITVLYEDLGLMMSLMMFVTPPLVAGQSLSGRKAGYAIITGVFVAVGTLLLDLYASWDRISFPVLAVITPVVTISVLILMGTTVYRQFRDYSLRTKLLVSVMALTALSVAVLALTNNYNSRVNLTTTAGSSLNSLANTQAAAVSEVLVQESHIIQSFTLNKLIQDRVEEANAAHDPNQAADLEQILSIDRQWRAADAADNDQEPVVSSKLNNEAASELRELRDAFPENVEVFVTDQYGALVASTNRTSDYYQADEGWWQAAYNNGKGALYFGQPEYDESSRTFGIILAIPLFEHGSKRVIGVTRTTLNITTMIEILNKELLGGTGKADLYLPGGQVLDPEYGQGLVAADPQALERLDSLLGGLTYDSFIYEGEEGIVSAAPVTTSDRDAQSAIDRLGWVLVVHQSKEAGLAPIRQQTRTTVFIALGILAIGALASIFLSRTLTGPILRLTEVAAQVSGGDLAQQAQIESSDEIGVLAGAFNAMTSQLHELIGSLEQRVADRTKALQTSTEVSRRLSTILDQKELVAEVVEQVQNAFHYYHAHIYLVDVEGRELIMAGGTGAAGKTMLAHGHKIPIGKGLVGLAAEHNSPVLVPDTSSNPDWLPNPLLPETRSEIAVPISTGETVVGVLDVQHHVINGLSQEDTDLLQAIASQVAIALRNARSYADVQARAEREALIASIDRKIQNETTVENALRVAIREVGRALGVSAGIRLNPGDRSN